MSAVDMGMQGMLRGRCERASGHRRNFRLWGEEDYSDLLIWCFFPRQQKGEMGRLVESERWMHVKRWPGWRVKAELAPKPMAGADSWL